MTRAGRTTPSFTVSFPADVLVVDDEKVVIQVLSRALKERGFAVTSADSGEAAVDLIEKSGFGCLVVDKNLPGIDGIEVVRRAKKAQPYCASIVITGYASTASAVEALRLGATDYLQKPFQDLDLVVEKVEKAIVHQRAKFERDAFLKRLREFEGELQDRSNEVTRQRTEIQMFNEVLEQRVRQATEDLLQKCQVLEASVRDSLRDGSTPATYTKLILDQVRQLDLTHAHPAGECRGMLTRVARQLEFILDLLQSDASRKERAAQGKRG